MGATTIEIMANHPSTGIMQKITVPTSGSRSDHMTVLFTSGCKIFVAMPESYRELPKVTFPPNYRDHSRADVAPKAAVIRANK